MVGYWQSIYPNSLVINSISMAGANKRQYFTPEYYFKEREQWNKDIRDTEA